MLHYNSTCQSGGGGPHWWGLETWWVSTNKGGGFKVQVMMSQLHICFPFETLCYLFDVDFDYS